jgi:hypothetical protein
MAVIDAWDFPGSGGAFATLPNTGDVLGHFRTGTGQNAWTVAVILNVDNVDQASRGVIWTSRRASNDERNHGVVFEPANNNYEYQYNAGAVHEPSLTEVNGTWVTIALSFAGGTGNITLRRIPLSTATQSHSSTGASGGSIFSDGQVQSVTIGGHYDATNLLDGQIAAILIVKGTELSQANLESWTADPLNYGDSLTSIHGADCFFWDDSGTDSGFNGLVAPTLSGTAARGVGNGPDIPVRGTPGGNVTNLFHKHNLGKVLLR